MDGLTKIVKNTLMNLEKNSLDATPDNYFREFFIQLESSDIKVWECVQFEKILNTLSIEEQKKIDTYSKLSLKLLEKLQQPQLEQNLKKTQKTDDIILKRFACELGEILAPSIYFDIEDEIDQIVSEVVNDPEKIFQEGIVNKLKETTKKRIEKDREVFFNKTKDIVKLTKLLSNQFEKTIITSDDSSKTFSNIKQELEKLDISKSSLRELGTLQTKLVNTICSLEDAIKQHKISLLEEKSNFSELEEKFVILQRELKQANEEKSIDFLTKIFNRRAFDNELKKIEKKHTLFDSNYAVVFYDLDHFKKINDKYGHECGDAVLGTFAGVLKKLTRQEDSVARYGGEEFVVLLNYNEPKEIIKYVNRVNDLVKKSEFKYKGKNIELTFSAGIAFRTAHETPEQTIIKADSLLYEAKKAGRDKVYIEDGTII